MIGIGAKSSTVETNGGSSLEFLFHHLCLHLPDVLTWDWRWIGIVLWFLRHALLTLLVCPHVVLVLLSEPGFMTWIHHGLAWYLPMHCQLVPIHDQSKFTKPIRFWLDCLVVWRGWWGMLRIDIALVNWQDGPGQVDLTGWVDKCIGW